MDTNEHDTYTSKHSSNGVIAVVRLKNNKLLSCYVFNNYDAGGWLIWKEPKNCIGL